MPVKARKGKSRPTMKIGGMSIPHDRLCADVSAASTAWLREQRPSKGADPDRRHRRKSQEEKDAKALATAHAKRMRADEREARELARLLRRVGYLSRRSAREAEAMLRVQVSWKPASRPELTTICPHNLYARLEPDVAERRAKVMKRSRIASDGFKNIYMSRTMRGFGRRNARTRPYRLGEAADLARYILRPDALEGDTEAWFTNIVSRSAEGDAASLEDAAQIVAFWNALESFEADVTDDGNVYSHLILAMPHELSPEGRSRALEDVCFRLNALHLPHVAALHHPDEQGDARNFHAHIIMATRPFSIDGPFAWSFEAGKATELNLTPGIHWLREQVAAAFNHALEREGAAVRYNGVSQAKRGVAATGDTHDGPAITARKRRESADAEARDAIVRQFVGHLAKAQAQHQELDSLISSEEARLARQVSMPTALGALEARFPDRFMLDGLSASDFAEFTDADREADSWYAPALQLAAELRDASWEVIRERNGRPALNPEEMKPEYAEILDAPRLPDIVEVALIEAHQRLLSERDGERERVGKAEKLRRDRMSWLRGSPVELFDEDEKLLPQYRAFFPPEVIALDGIRDAMRQCHEAAVATREASDSSDEAPAALSSPDASGTAADNQVPERENEDEDDWLFNLARQGVVKLPGGPGMGD